jgi:hypothetical protein
MPALTMAETPQEAYSRGHDAGEIKVRLANHDTQLATIVTTLAMTAGDISQLRLDTEALALAATNAARLVEITAKAATDARELTATAVKETKTNQDETVRQAAASCAAAALAAATQSKAIWTPFQRFASAVLMITAIGMLLLAWHPWRP